MLHTKFAGDRMTNYWRILAEVMLTIAVQNCEEVHDSLQDVKQLIFTVIPYRIVFHTSSSFAVTCRLNS
jgi:hypothetical protein